MKHLHVECIGGASGDMILGALVELGVPLEELRSALASLLTESFEINTEPAESMGITGLRLSVVVEGQESAGEPAEPHDGHHHHQSHSAHHTHHDHRALSSIEGIINGSTLPGEVKEKAIIVFRALGKAEAKIHGVPVENIHFHEVGAADSILDIVGSCWALNELAVDTVSIGAIPLGHGAIKCAHGVYPNPSPASLELISKLPVVQLDEPYELVTPTGAALLSQWKNTDAIPRGASLIKAAYSVGRRELLHRPNVLRATLYELESATEETDHCLVLECNLDDTTPELIGGLIDDLLANGALDVTCAPVTMKKQRPGTIVSVLCESAKREDMLELIFRGSTTFGVREYPVTRTKLARRFEAVSTEYGDVKVKVGTWRGDDITRAPEMDDCVRIAKEKGVSVRAVYEAAQKV